MLHVMGETYGLLPSEILRRADTFDMLVFDVAHTVREYKQKQKDPRAKHDIGKAYDTDQLQQALKNFRG
jgi:hypothetical protein